MRAIFNAEYYRKATINLPKDKLKIIDELQEKFKELFLPVQIFETDDKNKAAIVFERINRTGTKLDTYQLLTALSWSEEFVLQEEFQNLSDELEPFGFDRIADEEDLMLRCCCGVVTGKGTKSSLLKLKGEEFRKNFPIVKSSLIRAVDFLSEELNIVSLKLMPYPIMLIPLVRFFSQIIKKRKIASKKQIKQLKVWFWKSSFSRRYTNKSNEALEQDMALISKLVENENTDISSL